MSERHFTLKRIRLNNGGYDACGNYWGLDLPLWWYCSADYQHDEYIRAGDREAAKVEIRSRFPNATFYR